IAVNARNELEKMSFLQIRALHIALILRKNIFITVNIEITASTGKAALELKSSKLRDKGYCDWLRKVRAIIIDKYSMVNDDLLDFIVYLFTRSGITELDKVHFIITSDFFQLPPASGGLTEIFRQNDPEFKHHCTNLRYRFLNEDTFQYLKKCNYLEDDA
ncbi:15965_t:CDS:2, partial [Racocetra persica]